MVPPLPLTVSGTANAQELFVKYNANSCTIGACGGKMGGGEMSHPEGFIELVQTVGELVGATRQINERLGEMSHSLQHVAASQENLVQENAAQHEETARELAVLSEQTKNLQENVKELQKNVSELKQKSAGGPSLKAVDEVLSFAQRWWKPTVAVAVFVGGVVAAWFRG